MKPPDAVLRGVTLLSILAGCGMALLGEAPARAADGVEGVTAVASKVSGDYARAKLRDGSFQPEYYAFGEGGSWGSEISDATLEKLHFTDVARVIAGPLAAQNFLPARDPNKTRLLIMVYWGTTAVPEPYTDSMAYEQFRVASVNMGTPKADTSSKGYHALSSGNTKTGGGGDDAAWSAAMIMLMMVNRERDRTDFRNALMLGYDSERVFNSEYGNYVRGTALGEARNDLVSEIEENRYFVVLMAYDFQLMWKEKRHKLLWETRFSISERRNQFDKALPVMADYASRYFGQDSHGLMRTRVPEGKVEVREPTLIEFQQEPKQ
jgi:hypothetical protein